MEERNKTDPEIAQRKIFIGGLNYSTDDEKLRKYFSTYGKVQDAVVMKDPVSRRSRGFGFITYVDLDSVDYALAHEPHTIDSRKVEAKRAVPRSENPREIIVSKPTMAATVNSSSSGVKSVSDGNTIEAQRSGALGEQISAVVTNTRPSNDYTFNKIFVGGLHYDTRDADFKAYFEKFGKVMTGEVMFNRETHKSRGFGFIVFELEKSAENVCAQKEHIIDGKVVEVKRAIPRSKMLPGTKSPDGHAFGDSSIGVNSVSCNSHPIGTTTTTSNSTRESTPISVNGNPVVASVNSNFPNPNGATRPTSVVTPLSSYAAALRANSSSTSLASLGSSAISSSAINVSGDRELDFNALNFSTRTNSNDQLMADMMGQPLSSSLNDSNNLISPPISRAGSSSSQKGQLLSTSSSSRTYTDQAGNIQFMSDPHLPSNPWQPQSPTQCISSVVSIDSICSRGSIGSIAHSPMNGMSLQPPSPSRTPRTGSLDNSNNYSASNHGAGGGWPTLPNSPRQDTSQPTPLPGLPSITATSAPVHYDSYSLKCDNIYQDRSMLLFFSPRVAAERIASSSQRQYFDCVLPPLQSINQHQSTQTSTSNNRQTYPPLYFGNATPNSSNVPMQAQAQLVNDNHLSWGSSPSPSPSHSDLYLGFGSLPPPEIALTQPAYTCTSITAAGSSATKVMAIPTLSAWSSSITLSEANSVVSTSAISPSNPSHARSPLLSSLTMSGLPLSPGPPSSRDPWAPSGTGASTPLHGISMTMSRDAAGSFDASDNLSNLSSSHNGKADILNFQDFGIGSSLTSELRPNSAEWTPSRSLKSSRG